MSEIKLRIRIASSLAEVKARDWDACAAGMPQRLSAAFNATDAFNATEGTSIPAGTPHSFHNAFHNAAATAEKDLKLESEEKLSPQFSTQVKVDNPFISHAFLYALEQSHSVGGKTGWQTCHLLAEASDGSVLGAMPCYVKTHSRGEYVFDHGWAEAFAHAGGNYYPKLQVAVPFTPVTGPRLLTRSGVFAQTLRDRFAETLMELTHKNELSSAHVTFPTESEWHLLASRGYLQRTGQQFHWVNAGYKHFDDFLNALTSRKRKAIRRERKDALGRDIEVAWLTGREITESAWDAFFAFYMDTGSRKWGRPYLTREFFSRISESMSERILLVMAKRAGRWIAGALNFIGEDTLYGRYWGALEHQAFLHFELCYYQAIEYAIQHRLRRVEAGAQGEHKLARGYLPHKTYSAHFIADPALRLAVADYLTRERSFVDMMGDELSTEAPFRKILNAKDQDPECQG